MIGDNMKKVAIIPARSGSKGLKDKNIQKLCEKPLLVYSVEAALKAEIFDCVILSTDSKLYASVAADYNIKVMYRDETLASDDASTYDVIKDLLSRLEEKYDYFALLQPTSPMRDENHVKEAVRLFENQYDKFDFLVSVKKAEYTSSLVKPIDEDNSLKFFCDDFSNYKRQLYDEYSPNGAIFIGKTDKYMEHKHFYGSRSLAYKMNDFDSVDIDTILDYELAKICMRKKLSGQW